MSWFLDRVEDSRGSWILDHEMAVQESCNEAEYVRTCVKKTQVPGKFCQDVDLTMHGITFHQDEKYKSYQESGVPVNLPQHFKMKGDGNCLMINDVNTGKVIFSARVSDNRGYATWYKSD